MAIQAELRPIEASDWAREQALDRAREQRMQQEQECAMQQEDAEEQEDAEVQEGAGEEDADEQAKEELIRQLVVHEEHQDTVQLTLHSATTLKEAKRALSLSWVHEIDQALQCLRWWLRQWFKFKPSEPWPMAFPSVDGTPFVTQQLPDTMPEAASKITNAIAFESRDAQGTKFCERLGFTTGKALHAELTRKRYNLRYLRRKLIRAREGDAGNDHPLVKVARTKTSHQPASSQLPAAGSQLDSSMWLSLLRLAASYQALQQPQQQPLRQGQCLPATMTSNNAAPRSALAQGDERGVAGVARQLDTSNVVESSATTAYLQSRPAVSSVWVPKEHQATHLLAACPADTCSNTVSRTAPTQGSKDTEAAAVPWAAPSAASSATGAALAAPSAAPSAKSAAAAAFTAAPSATCAAQAGSSPSPPAAPAVTPAAAAALQQLLLPSSAAPSATCSAPAGASPPPPAAPLGVGAALAAPVGPTASAAIASPIGAELQQRHRPQCGRNQRAALCREETAKTTAKAATAKPAAKPVAAPSNKVAAKPAGAEGVAPETVLARAAAIPGATQRGRRYLPRTPGVTQELAAPGGVPQRRIMTLVPEVQAGSVTALFSPCRLADACQRMQAVGGARVRSEEMVALVQHLGAVQVQLADHDQWHSIFNRLVTPGSAAAPAARRGKRAVQGKAAAVASAGVEESYALGTDGMGNQRQQLVLRDAGQRVEDSPEGEFAVLSEIIGLAEAMVGTVVKGRLLTKAAVLRNRKPDFGHTAVRQTLHVDYEDDNGGLAVIVALEVCYLVVCPFSHKILAVMDIAADKSQAEYDAWVAGVAQQSPLRPVRITLQPGDMFFLGPSTVHGGEAGSADGAPAFRLHLYFQPRELFRQSMGDKTFGIPAKYLEQVEETIEEVVAEAWAAMVRQEERLAVSRGVGRGTTTHQPNAPGSGADGQSVGASRDGAVGREDTEEGSGSDEGEGVSDGGDVDSEEA